MNNLIQAICNVVMVCCHERCVPACLVVTIRKVKGCMFLSDSLSLSRNSFLLWSDAMAFCLPSHFSLKFQIKKNYGNGIIYGIKFANFEIYF